MSRKTMFGMVPLLLGALLSAFMFGASYGFAADRQGGPSVLLISG